METVNYAEQITAFEARRATAAGGMSAIMAKSAEAGETLDAAQKEEFDTFERDIGAIDDHLKRLRSLEKANAVAAPPVPTQKGEDPVLTASYGSVQLKAPVEKGIAFTRLIGAKYLAAQHHCAPWDIAKRWTDTPEVEYILRAAIAPGSTTDSTFAAPLVQLTNIANDFIDLVRAKEIIGRIQGLDRVPFNIQVPRGTQDPTAYWVGQGDVKPVSRSAFDSVSLTFAKVAGIVPMTEELMKFSNPSAERLVRNGLVKAIAYLTDRDFLDPTKAASTGISPASLTNGVTPVTPTGTTADAFRDDFATMLVSFGDLELDGLVLVMTSAQAIRLSLMRNSLGTKEFPDITPNGGSIEGFPVITSSNIASTGGSPVDGYPIVAICAPDVYLAEEGVTVDMSREASLQMDSAPDSPETASTVMVSLWQRNLVALKAERYITWAKKHSTSVQFINYAKYA